MKNTKGKTPSGLGTRSVDRRSRNGPSAGKRIIAAIAEATEVLRAEGLESKRLTIRSYTVPSAPTVCRSGDVKRVREQLGASQSVLARFLGVNVNTVRSWEQGKRSPQAIACRFLSESVSLNSQNQ
jgi:putative transcriptional regulator